MLIYVRIHHLNGIPKANALFNIHEAIESDSVDFRKSHIYLLPTFMFKTC